MNDELERIVAFMETIADRAARRVVASAYGVGHFNDELPRRYGSNYLRLDDRAAGVSAAELAEEAERLHAAAGLRHRKIEVDDAGLGDGLASGFRELGWKVERLVVMVNRRPPDRDADLSAVSEVDRETVSAARGLWMRDEREFDEETIGQLLEAMRVYERATRVRRFAAAVDGTVASWCELYSDGSTAQIEDVATLPEHRGRGLASAVVLRALDAAKEDGHDLVFLVANEDDWPKELYRTLGFDEVGRLYDFLRPPAD